MKCVVKVEFPTSTKRYAFELARQKQATEDAEATQDT